MFVFEIIIILKQDENVSIIVDKIYSISGAE